MKPALLDNGIVLVLVLLLVSCKTPEEESKRPGNILSEEKFFRVLVDFSLAESAATLNIMNLHTVPLDSAAGFDPLAEHGVRKSQFDSTIRYYSYHPEEYKRIYDSVLTCLSDMQNARTNRLRDSVAK